MKVPEGEVMGSTQTESDQKNGTRARLLRAGLELLVARGYLGATARDIARAAGVTEVTMYRHFRSKDELFVESFTAQHESVLALIPEPSGSVRRDLEALLDNFYGYLSALPVQGVQLLSELRRHSKTGKIQVDLLEAGINQRLGHLFRHYQETGVLATGDIDHIRIAFMGPIYFYASLDDKDSRARVPSEVYVERFLQGYGKSRARNRQHDRGAGDDLSPGVS
jgi:AcrR family transcriptional regulator